MTGPDLRGLLDLLNGLHPEGMVRAIFPEADEFYVREKAALFHRDPVRWMSSLDHENLTKLAKLATERGQVRGS